MIGRRALLVAAASATVVGLAAWRGVTVHDALYARVEGRLAETAALTRDVVQLWLEERERDARSAALAHADGAAAEAADTEVLEMLRAGHGYDAVWRVDADGAVLAGARVALSPTEAERDAARAAGGDGDLHVVGPFAAPTASGLAVSVAYPATEGKGAAVILRRDPVPTLLPLVVRRVQGSSEIGRLLVTEGGNYLMVSPAPRGGHALRRGRVADLPLPQQRVVRGGRERTSYDADDGRAVLAGLDHVPGTPWTVVRRVDRAEIAASAAAQLGTEALLLLAALSAAGLGVLAATRAERAERLREVAAREARLADSLRASEASARGFVEHAPYGICRVAVDGRFTEVNPALVRMLAYPDDATLLRADLGELYLDPAARAQILRRHAEGEALVDGVETVWRRADGGERPVRLHSREVRDTQGAIAYYEAYVTDLGALRTAEQALRQAEKLAAVGQFVSGVAHELNNPLSAVLLFADGLLDDAERSDDDREVLTLVRDQALRARAIVRDLLAFVRGTSGATATVSARAVLDAAARALAPQVAATGGRLDVALDADLGWLRVDRAAVEQVVTNLVMNAAQAAPGATVQLAAARSGASLCIRVDDDGPGIPPDVLARMFEPFFTTKPVGLGTGLGLSVSLGIVERHGGTLVAENHTPPEPPGARLTVTLPLAPRPVELGALAADASATATAEWPALAAAADVLAHRVTRAPGRTPRLLVVDDEVPIRQALDRFFTRRGWTVDEAGDGRAAFARLLESEAAGTPYDLVLSDVRMPGVSGIVLHDWLARTRPALLDRLVFATGDTASPESAEFVQRTRCLVLNKPFESSALEALAQRAVDGNVPAGSPDVR